LIPKGATWVRFPRFVGDAVMQFPILRLLRQINVGPLVVWGPATTVCLVKGNALADYTISENERISALGLSKNLIQHHPARTICFPKSLRPVLAAWMAGVPERIGISDGGARLLNTHHTPFWKTSGPFVLRYRAALKKLWPDLTDLPYADYVPNVQVDRPKNTYICLMPGSVWSSKAWPPEYYRVLATKARQFGLEVAVLGTSAEAGLADIILDGMGYNLCGQTDLCQAAAWLHGAWAAVGNDSGLSHLAAACGTKTVAIYGPTDPGGSAPWGPRVITLQPYHLNCSPCFKRSCPLPKRECLLEITPDQVWGHLG